jgi:allantoinase
VLRADRFLTPSGERSGCLVLRAERIAEVAERVDVMVGEVIDLGPVVLLPGLVDTHVHVNEPAGPSGRDSPSATFGAAAEEGACR